MGNIARLPHGQDRQEKFSPRQRCRLLGHPYLRWDAPARSQLRRTCQGVPVCARMNRTFAPLDASARTHHAEYCQPATTIPSATADAAGASLFCSFFLFLCQAFCRFGSRGFFGASQAATRPRLLQPFPSPRRNVIISVGGGDIHESPQKAVHGSRIYASGAMRQLNPSAPSGVPAQSSLPLSVVTLRGVVQRGGQNLPLYWYSSVYFMALLGHSNVRIAVKNESYLDMCRNTRQKQFGFSQWDVS